MSNCRWCGTKARTTCACGANVCDRDAHYYVDESNRAVNASALPKCPACAGIQLKRPYTELQAERAWEW